MSSESTRYLNRPVDDELNQDHISWLTNNMKPDAKLRFASYTLSMASAASSGDPTCQTACRACLDFANSQVPIVSEKVKADMQSNNTNPLVHSEMIYSTSDVKINPFCSVLHPPSSFQLVSASQPTPQSSLPFLPHLSTSPWSTAVDGLLLCI
jgi:hypothetical protein